MIPSQRRDAAVLREGGDETDIVDIRLVAEIVERFGIKIQVI